MYKIKRTDYGIHVVMGGTYGKNEIKTYIREKEALIATFSEPYSIMVDLRTAIPPDHEDARLLRESHERLKNTHLQRIAIIINSPVVIRRAKQVMFDGAMKEYMRIINCSKFSNWEEVALNWLNSAIDPVTLNDSTENFERQLL